VVFIFLLRIIDGHSHACGRYLTAEGIESMHNNCGANKAVIVPGVEKPNNVLLGVEPVTIMI